MASDRALTASILDPIQSGHGTRLIPAGTLTGAHFLKTPSYVQVTGKGHLKNLNITPKDEGGELDPHGATGAGNPGEYSMS